MLQKTIWIGFLIIGVLVNLLISCTTTKDYNIETSYVYKNLTSKTVLIKYFENDINTKTDTFISGDQKVKKYSDIGGKNGGIIVPFNNYSKVVLFLVEDNKCITYNYDGKFLNYKMYDNYNPSMENNSINTLIFNIDQEEVDLAIPCN